METLDISMHDFIQNPEDYAASDKFSKDPFHAFLLYIFGIACTLDLLQTKLKFVHGDFHCENVMLRERQGIVYPYIVDFGFTAIDVSSKRYVFDPFYRKVVISVHLEI